MKREQIVIVNQINNGGQQAAAPGFFGAFFVFILFCMFWKWVLVIVGSIAAVVLFAWLANAIVKDLRTQARLDADRKDRLRANADAQHNLYMQGDPRGTYGEELGS